MSPPSYAGKKPPFFVTANFKMSHSAHTTPKGGGLVKQFVSRMRGGTPCGSEKYENRPDA